MRTLRPDVTEGPRSDIYETVLRVPGAHLRGIERLTSLPLGQVLYHLDRLERMGLVVSKRDAGFRRYYVASVVSRGEKLVLAALRHAAARRIVLALLERGPLSHKELQPILGVAGSTLSFHLQRLVAAGVVRRERRDAQHAFLLVEPGLARRELVFYRESFQDREVDRFVDGLLASLPVPDPAPPEPVRVPVQPGS